MKNSSEATPLFAGYTLHKVEDIPENQQEQNRLSAINLYSPLKDQLYNRIGIDFSLSQKEENWDNNWFNSYE